MSSSRRLKLIIKKLGLALAITPSVFLVVGCLLCYYKLNVYSFFFSLIIPSLLILNILIFIYWLIKKLKYLYIPLLSLFIYFILFNAPIQLNSNASKTDKVFSFMTFNVRGFGSTNIYRDLVTSEKIIDFVKGKNPDIICFQEFSRFEFQSLSYYPYKFVGYRTNFEKTLQVIYSKYPIINSGYVDFPNTRNQAIYADIKFENEIIRMYNIHLQSYKLRVNKSNFSLVGLRIISRKVKIAQSKQEEQVQIVINHAKTFSGKIIFSGDFNSTQYSTNYKFLKNNMNDSFVEAGFGLGATYSSINFPFRIDYVLADEGLDIISHQNFDIKLSDHEPIFVNLKLK